MKFSSIHDPQTTLLPTLAPLDHPFILLETTWFLDSTVPSDFLLNSSAAPTHSGTLVTLPHVSPALYDSKAKLPPKLTIVPPMTLSVPSIVFMLSILPCETKLFGYSTGTSL